VSNLNKPQIQVAKLPLKYKFRGLESREFAYFRGQFGLGEFSPFIEYSKIEATTWFKAGWEAANTDRNLIIKNFVRDKVPINITVPEIQINEIESLLQKFSGCHVIKLKVNEFENIKPIIVELIKQVPNSKFRLDVNGGWTFVKAKAEIPKFIELLGDRLDYFEQPCTEIKDMAELRAEFKIKVAIDESIRKSMVQEGKNSKVNFSDFADVAIIKWAPSGGLTKALNLIETIGLPVVVSSALDSPIGISYGLALAQSVKNLYGPCGLGTAAFFVTNSTKQENFQLQIQNGFLSYFEADASGFAEYSADQERNKWWQQRFDQVWEYFLNERN